MVIFDIQAGILRDIEHFVHGQAPSRKPHVEENSPIIYFSFTRLLAGLQLAGINGIVGPILAGITKILTISHAAPINLND